MKKNLKLTLGIVCSLSLMWLVSGLSVTGQEPTKDRTKYKGKSIYKTPIDPDTLPKGKFIKGNPKAVKGQYIVWLADEIESAEVEQLAQALVKEYGGTIPKDGIFTLAGKGFVLNANEAEAERMSENPKVDRIIEDIEIKLQFPIHSMEGEEGKKIQSLPVKPRPEIQQDKLQEEAIASPDFSGARFNVTYNLDRIDTRPRTYDGTFN